MLTLPFPLETFPAERADAELRRLRSVRASSQPVLLGDADIFSTEWAEIVDAFEPPEAVLTAAREIDADAWFASHAGPAPAPRPGPLARAARRLGGLFRARTPDTPLDMLKAQLAELEAAGEDWAEAREALDAMEAEGGAPLFPDPIAYVTPRRGAALAAGLVETAEPWEAVAWLQHGAYALCAPRPVLAAHCRWLWERHGARIITASTDHIGFELGNPIETAETAAKVLRRFLTLGASEVNADRCGTDGASLVGAGRLWVWWD